MDEDQTTNSVSCSVPENLQHNATSTRANIKYRQALGGLRSVGSERVPDTCPAFQKRDHQKSEGREVNVDRSPKATRHTTREQTTGKRSRRGETRLEWWCSRPRSIRGWNGIQVRRVRRRIEPKALAAAHTDLTDEVDRSARRTLARKGRKCTRRFSIRSKCVAVTLRLQPK